MFSEREAALFQRYDASYRVTDTEVMRQIERQVCGCDFGASSWATRDQVDAMISALDLSPRSHLLDIGAGSGWPALYIAEKTGCRVALVDVPEAGLAMARKRAEELQMPDRVETRATDAADTGFPDADFDAVTHSDVLCCLPHKEAVLAECRRVVRPDGQMRFSVIYVPKGLAPEAERQGIEAGPEFVGANKTYPDLLRDAGWQVVSEADATEAHGRAYQHQIETDLEHETDLVDVLGREAFTARVESWRLKVAAIEAGVLCRANFHAIPVVR